MKSVYGLMTNAGNGNEFLYDLGVWETEEEAGDFLKNELPHSSGIWIEALKVNDATPESLVIDSDEMQECSMCQIEYNRADIIEIEDVSVCINCEPAYRENIPG